MSRVGLIGDIHGNSTWMVYALQRLSLLGITEVIQLGDFGIGMGGDKDRFVRSVDAACRTYRIKLIVTHGNHENMDLINAIPVSTDGFRHLTDNISFATAGARWKMGGRSFVALPGAASVDRTYRQCMERDRRAQGRSDRYWWPEEAITREDVDAVVAGGYADIMVGHDAPIVEEIQKRIRDNPHGFEQRDIDYANENRKLMDEAVAGVKPKLTFSGHYHFAIADEIRWPDDPVSHIAGTVTNVVVFDRDTSENNFGFVETDDFSISVAPNERYEYLIQQGRSPAEAKFLLDKL